MVRLIPSLFLLAFTLLNVPIAQADLYSCDAAELKVSLHGEKIRAHIGTMMIDLPRHMLPWVNLAWASAFSLDTQIGINVRLQHKQLFVGAQGNHISNWLIDPRFIERSQKDNRDQYFFAYQGHKLKLSDQSWEHPSSMATAMSIAKDSGLLRSFIRVSQIDYDAFEELKWHSGELDDWSTVGNFRLALEVLPYQDFAAFDLYNSNFKFTHEGNCVVQALDLRIAETRPVILNDFNRAWVTKLVKEAREGTRVLCPLQKGVEYQVDQHFGCPFYLFGPQCAFPCFTFPKPLLHESWKNWVFETRDLAIHEDVPGQVRTLIAEFIKTHDPQKQRLWFPIKCGGQTIGLRVDINTDNTKRPIIGAIIDCRPDSLDDELETLLLKSVRFAADETFGAGRYTFEGPASVPQLVGAVMSGILPILLTKQ